MCGSVLPAVLRDVRQQQQLMLCNGCCYAQEHPLLRVPCYMLHPCQTAERMALLMAQRAAGVVGGAASEQQQLLSYMQAWSSMMPALALTGEMSLVAAW